MLCLFQAMDNAKMLNIGRIYLIQRCLSIKPELIKTESAYKA